MLSVQIRRLCDVRSRWARATVAGPLAAILFALCYPAIVRASNLTVLWTFAGAPNDGSNPNAPILIAKNGTIYGTTSSGGTYNAGTVYELVPPGTGQTQWTEAILWSFGNGSDASHPSAGVIVDANGDLFATTKAGGLYGGGTVYELTPPPAGRTQWAEAVLWSFGNGNDGSGPVSSLLADKNGNLYGTTPSGGAFGSPPSALNYGTAYELTPPSAGQTQWTESILWNFGQAGDPYLGPGDGINPQGNLLADSTGNLYGTTPCGGVGTMLGRETFSCGGGIAFELTPTVGGGSSTETILHDFQPSIGFDGCDFSGSSTDGCNPLGGLLADASGNLFGTTQYGPFSHLSGTVFELSPPAAGQTEWTESVPWVFDTAGGGNLPASGVISDAAGNLYGTTLLGGSITGVNDGVMYELAPPASGETTWSESVLWDFSGTFVAGLGNLALDSSGNLYGTSGGAVYEIQLSPTPTPSATATPTPSATPTPTATSTPTPSATPTVTATPSPTVTPTPLPPTTLIASPKKLSFGKVDASATSAGKQLTLENEGTDFAMVGALIPPASFTLSKDNCSLATLPAEGKCTIEIAFAPNTPVGKVTESFAIPYNGISPSETLNGDGEAVTLKAPKSRSLAAAADGTIGKAKTITIKNDSGASVQLGAASLGSYFTITADTCANAALPSKSDCVVTVAFAPIGGITGQQTGTLEYPFTYGLNSGSLSIGLKAKVKS